MEWQSQTRTTDEGVTKVVFSQAHFFEPAMVIHCVLAHTTASSNPASFFPPSLSSSFSLSSYHTSYSNLSHTSVLQLKSKLVLRAFPNNFRL